MTPVRLEPAALRSRVKHSTTEPLRSLYVGHIGLRRLTDGHLGRNLEYFKTLNDARVASVGIVNYNASTTRINKEKNFKIKFQVILVFYPTILCKRFKSQKVEHVVLSNEQK